MTDSADIARDVLVEAFGASATPFVPVPFVDGFLFKRLLKRIARKVLDRHGIASAPLLGKAIVDAYVKAGSSPLAKSIVVGAARFVMRKVAIVLDVKKSHDVFGESIAFAVAMVLAVENGWIHGDADALGGAMHRAISASASGALEGLVRAGREAFTGAGGPLAGAIGDEVEKLKKHLQDALEFELGRRLRT